MPLPHKRKALFEIEENVNAKRARVAPARLPRRRTRINTRKMNGKLRLFKTLMCQGPILQQQEMAAVQQFLDIDIREYNDVRRYGRPIDRCGHKQAMRMKEIYDPMRRCKTCFQNHFAWKNLPCGHITNCGDCKPHMRLCAQCYCGILDTIAVHNPDWFDALRFWY